MEPLICNRTAAVPMNAKDLNRIEEWTEILAQKLTNHGYFVTVDTDKVWSENDSPYHDEINRIRSNINALRDGFFAIPDWRDIVFTNSLNFEQVNVLEWDLQTIYNWLEKLLLFRHRCGVAVCGRHKTFGQKFRRYL